VRVIYTAFTGAIPSDLPTPESGRDDVFFPFFDAVFFPIAFVKRFSTSARLFEQCQIAAMFVVGIVNNESILEQPAASHFSGSMLMDAVVI